MKKITLSPAHSLLLILFICITIIVVTINVDLKGSHHSKSFSQNNKERLDREEESSGFMIWESLSNRLLTVYR